MQIEALQLTKDYDMRYRCVALFIPKVRCSCFLHFSCLVHILGKPIRKYRLIGGLSNEYFRKTQPFSNYKLLNNSVLQTDNISINLLVITRQPLERN